MTTPGWLKPWMIAVVLAAVGIAGAIEVVHLSGRQHAHDRSDLQRWTAQVDPVVTRVRAALDALPGAAAEERTALSGGLSSARAALVDSNAPSIVATVAQEYVSAIDQAIAALDAGGDPAAYASAIARARATFGDGDKTLAEIRCRLLTECAKT